MDNGKISVPVVLGMDAGGTKTKVEIADLTGRTLAVFTGDGMNVNSFSEAECEAHLAAMLQEAMDHLESRAQIRSVSVGIAGISNPKTQAFLERGIRSFGLEFDPRVMGDQEAALYGAHGGADGIILIAGTGSIAYGMRSENGLPRFARSGGWGHLIDDEGSGYAIGRDVLSMVVRAEDHRIPATCLREAVFERLGIACVKELISFVYNPSTGKKEIAALAPLIMMAYEKGEPAAAAVLNKAADELSKNVLSVAQQLELSNPSLCLFGGVLTKNAVLREKLEKRLAEKLPGLTVKEPMFDAAHGAVIAALQHAAE